MRIAMVCVDRRRIADDLALNLARAHHEVTIVRRDDGGGTTLDETFVGESESGPVGVARDALVPGGPARALGLDEVLDHMADFGHALADLWMRDTPHVIHAHTWAAGIAAQVGARALGLPIVQSFHELGIVRRRHLGTADESPPTRVRLERSLALASARVIAGSSDEVFELFRMGVPHAKSTVLPTGVDTSRFTRDSADPPTPRLGPGLRIVSVGPILPERGHDCIVHALAAVPGAHLVVADPAPQGEGGRWLMREAAASRVGDRVHVIDWPADLPAFLRSGDLAAVTPWYDPSGEAALQAMACGVPVLGTAVGAIVDIVVDGITGALVTPRRPDIAAEALRRMNDDQFGMRAMGIAGADRAAHRYNWTRIADETARVYKAVGRRTLPVAMSR